MRVPLALTLGHCGSQRVCLELASAGEKGGIDHCLRFAGVGMYYRSADVGRDRSRQLGSKRVWSGLGGARRA